MSSYKQVSSVGNMDPNILENWYFALWAYNGWSQSNNPVSPYAKKYTCLLYTSLWAYNGWAQSNNPNIAQSNVKKYTYQQLIYDVIENEYGGKIHNIDFSYLPSTGKPSRSLVVPTPLSLIHI